MSEYQFEEIIIPDPKFQLGDKIYYIIRKSKSTRVCCECGYFQRYDIEDLGWGVVEDDRVVITGIWFNHKEEKIQYRLSYLRLDDYFDEVLEHHYDDIDEHNLFYDLGEAQKECHRRNSKS